MFMIDNNNIDLLTHLRVNNLSFPVQQRTDLAGDIQNFQGSQRTSNRANTENIMLLLNQLTSMLSKPSKGSANHNEHLNNTHGVTGGETQTTTASSQRVNNNPQTNNAIATRPAPSAKAERTAVFYGDNLPTDDLSNYKRVIVEAGNVSPTELSALRKKDSDVFAYVSIGEANKNRPWYNEINPNWMLGDNKTWDSKVMDLNNKGWQDFVIDRVVSPLWDKGYRGLFLDTMDSFQLFAKDKPQQDTQINALSRLMGRIQERFPEMHFISNRGFEVLSSMEGKLDAVVAESLFSSWDNSKKTYANTSEQDQTWLLNKLNDVKRDLGVDVVVIDYVKPNDLKNAKQITDKITQQGFSPWVSVPSLDVIPSSEL